MAVPEFWIRGDGGDWNGNPAADPTTGVGGISLAGVTGQMLAPIIQGSDAQLTGNFGQSVFAHSVPSTFTPGWPAAAGGWTVLDPAKASGGAVVSGGGLTMTSGTIYGACQVHDAWDTGRYYFEVTNVHDTFFTSFQGAGVGRVFPGIDYNFWASNGQYGTLDLNGGGLYIGGSFNTFIGRIASCGAISVNPSFAAVNGTVIGLAFAITGVPTPTPTPTPSPTPTPTPSPTTITVPVPQSLDRWRGAVGINWMGLALVGDAFSNTVGLSDFDNFTEYGNTMRFLVSTPPVQNDRARIFIPRFEIEVEAGAGQPNGTEPLMVLEVSKDGGETWMALRRARSMGLVGEYIKRLRWLNLGHSRKWVFRLTCTDPVRRTIIGTYIGDYEGLG